SCSRARGRPNRGRDASAAPPHQFCPALRTGAWRFPLRKASDLHARAAKSIEHAAHRQPHHVVRRTIDPGDEFAAASLDSVGAGLVEGFAAGHVVANLLVRERPKEHAAFHGLGFDDFAAAGDRERGNHHMAAAGERPKHPVRIGGILRFLQNLAGALDHGVGPDHDCFAIEARDGGRLRAGHPQRIVARILARRPQFLDTAFSQIEGEARLREKFAPARRAGGKDQLLTRRHRGFRNQSRVLPDARRSRKAIVAFRLEFIVRGRPQLKRLDWYANHDWMEMSRRRHLVTALLLGVAIAGCATAVARSQAVTADSAPSEASTTTAAPAEPTSPESAPADAKQAFADGYRAYVARDYRRAVTDLSVAAARYPTLGDYALFYMALAQAEQGNLADAAATLQRLRAEYAQSVMVPRGELELAHILLKLGRSSDSYSVALHLAATTTDSSLEQNARFAEAQALAAMGKTKDAYEQAMAIRQTYPRGEVDSRARGLAYSILAANPSVSAASPFDYHRGEAALLLREGLASLALGQAEKAMPLAPTAPDRAELYWIEAQALKGEPERQKRALLQYLAIAPRGPAASAVLYNLALVYWKEEDLDRARATFSRVVGEFPSSSHAAPAMLRIGRIFEEQRDYEAARQEYGRLVD